MQEGIMLMHVGPEDDEGGANGFMYSYNNGNRPEFLALDVPEAKSKAVAGVMNFLAERTCESGQTVHSKSGGVYLLLYEVTGDRRSRLLDTHMLFATNPMFNPSPQKPIFQLIPLFESDDPAAWGNLPAAPQGREDLVDAIIEAWRHANNFIRFVDGNRLNCSIANLERVDLAFALKHSHTMHVNWKEYLSDEQWAFVRKNIRYFRQLVGALYPPKDKRCEVCGSGLGNEEEQAQLSNCGGCKSAWYCCREHQIQDRAAHKKECNRMKSWINRE
jgi:hypothetical protein